MNTGKLQRFGYKDSPYHRPNQDWVCGYAASGQECPRGPDARGRCAGSDHCDPIREGGRWVCTRSDLLGGQCAAGPDPAGHCGSALPPCQPRRSLRARRRLLTRWVATVTVGVLLLIVGGTQGMALLEPGPRIHGHAQLGSCSACHAGAERRPSEWLGMIAGDAVDDSQRCVRCHRVGDEPQLAHSLRADVRAALTAAAPVAGTGSAPVAAAATWLVDPAEPLECGQCHREHRGADADITAIIDGRCQSCHVQRFASFEDGHPAFSPAYPSTRRTRIQFDHVTHIGKHFADADDPATAPTACGDCHVAATDGGMMAVRGFEVTCSGCHADDIAGAGRADSPGLAVLQVPGFDVESLHASGLVTGHWPEFAEGRGGAFLPVLLGAESDARVALAALDDADWLDLSAAGDDQRQAAQTLIWAYKRLLLDLRARGAPALIARLEAGGAVLDDGLKRRLASGLSVHAIDAAVSAWFPGLEEEWAAHLAGELKPPKVERAAAPKPKPAAVDDDEFADLFGDGGDLLGDADAQEAPAASTGSGNVDDDEFDALFGSDDLFSGDPELLAEDEPEAQPEPATPAVASLDERMRLGGWYLDDLALRYRPSGHADALIQTWLQQRQRPAVVGELSDPDAPGRCTKCHSVDSGAQGLVVNWHAAQPDPKMHAFTTFSHRPHFTVMGDDGCSGCHTLNPDSAYAEAFEDTDPSAFESNFRAIGQARCASCHMGEQADSECTTCHSYHVGEFAATEPFTRLSEALAAP